jgi:hypothetical protein
VVRLIVALGLTAADGNAALIVTLNPKDFPGPLEAKVVAVGTIDDTSSGRPEALTDRNREQVPCIAAPSEAFASLSINVTSVVTSFLEWQVHGRTAGAAK